MTEIAGIPFDVLAPSALLGLVVLLILTDRLVPRRRLDEKAAEVEGWKQEAEAWKAAADETNKQNAAMLRAFGPTLTDFLQGLRRVGVANQEEGIDS